MTFTLRAKQGDDLSFAETGPVLFLKTLKTKAKPAAVSSEPVDGASVLTSADVESLRREGRKAAFEGKSLRSCPYNVASRERRDAWLEGFSAGK